MLYIIKNRWHSSLSLLLVVVLSNVDVGDPRCPIHGEDAIFIHKQHNNKKLS